VSRRREALGEWRRRAPLLGLVAAGGALGSLARYEIVRASHVTPGSFPWPTFVVNVTGAFALGLLVAVVAVRFPTSRYARPFLGIGFLGAYTTMSSLAVEAVVLGRDGHAGIAAVYVGSSMVGGVAACSVGLVAGRSR
jgi:CrcB protein